MMFCEIIHFVLFTGFPVNKELALTDMVVDPVEAHVNCFGAFCLTVSVAIPTAVLLSVCRGVTGCGWPNSFNATRIGQASLALWKVAASSASVALATISHIIWQET